MLGSQSNTPSEIFKGSAPPTIVAPLPVRRWKDIRGRPLKIQTVEVFQYEVSYRDGVYTMSHGRAQAGEPSLVVRITTDDGLTGWGETCPHGGTYLPGFFESEREALKLLGSVVLGCDPREAAAIQARMLATLLGGMGAKSAIDIACLDIAGKAAGVPVCTLLGGRLHDSMPVFEAIPVGSVAVMSAGARKAVARGLKVLQVKVGNDPLEDAARVAAVREVVGPDFVLIADANGGWNLQHALLAASEMAVLRTYLEQPCRSAQNCGEVARRGGLPVMVDECVTNVEDLVVARTQLGASGINIKPGRVGGLTPARLLRDTATELGMMIAVDETWGGAIVSAALSHLGASTRPNALLCTCFFTEFTAPLVANGPRMRADGTGSAPAGPGLGIEVDEDRLGEPIAKVAA